MGRYLRFEALECRALLTGVTAAGNLDAPDDLVGIIGDPDLRGPEDVVIQVIDMGDGSLSPLPTEDPHLAEANATSTESRPVPDSENIWQTPTHGEWYEDNPTYIDNYDDAGDWEFSTPED